MARLLVTEYGETKPPRLALLMRERLDPPGSPFNRYWVLEAECVALVEDETPRNLSDRQPLRGVIGRCQSEGPESGTYGYRTLLQTWGLMDSAEVDRALKALRAIERGMHRLAERYGWLGKDDLVQFMFRFADVVGTETFVVQTKRGADGLYSSGEYRIMDRSEAMSWLLDRRREAFESLGEEVSA